MVNVSAVREWIAADPDEDDRAELAELLSRAEEARRRLRPSWTTGSPRSCSSAQRGCVGRWRRVPSG